MDTTTLQRGQTALIGALAGISFYLLSEIVDSGLLGDRAFLALATFATTFFTGLLAIAGPLALLRAVVSVAALAAVTTLLFLWASFRFSTLDDNFFGPFPVLATAVIGTVPLPFIIAASGPGWRDYPALFSAAWTIVVRYAAAWAFVGVVWGVIFLSDLLLSIVGLNIIEDLIDINIVPFILTGLTLGLALAVVQEFKEYISPFLILRLLRLLLPAVLVVMIVFVVALPVQGLSGLFGELSVAAILLAMTAGSATLISTAIDQNDADATQSPFLAGATQALAVILPIPAGLAAYAVWLRIDQYGLTPDRLFAALMAALAVGYGLFYAVAVVRRAGWMDRIRRANIVMALAGVAAAALWLTPILNAERMSANTLVARYQSGATPLAALDVNQLNEWGFAGDAARATLEARAKKPGQEALATALASATARFAPQDDPDPAKTLADLVAVLPLQPATATTDRDRLLAGLQSYDIASWLGACRTPMADGKPGCVMVVADFSQTYPGPEAMVVLRDAGNAMRYEALVQVGGSVERRSLATLQGYLPYDAGGAQIIAQLQAAPPVLSPVPLSQITVGGQGIIIFP